MSNELSFKFYSVFGNDDADPFIADRLLAVADGLNGSGATRHTLEDSRYGDLKKLKQDLQNCIVPDYCEERHAWLKPYIESWLKPMADTVPDTSALWGSRIALARLVFALQENQEYRSGLHDEKVRKQLSAFITEGLNLVAKEFDLQTRSEYQEQLPTTLAALTYNVVGNNAEVETVWAGDSRCYALTAQGLKQLTIDDVDDMTEVVTNFFRGGEESAVLNYRSHSIPLPCILLTCNDGVFAPHIQDVRFDFEALLLKNIQDSRSAQELCENLKSFYDKIHDDDATMVCAPVGFGSYDDIRKWIESRCGEVLMA